LVTLVAAAHLGHFSSLADIARAKAEIFEGVEPGGHALINRDDRQWKLLAAAAKEAGVEHIWGFGAHERATFRLTDCHLGAEGSAIVVKIAGREIAAEIGAPGRHIAQNATAVLGAAYLAGADVDAAARALAGFKAEQGRGRRHRLAHPDGGSFVLIDESYNANPASMVAALGLMASTPTGEGGRHIAVLGDMLELGSHAAALHAGLADPLREAGADIALLAGPEMASLAQALSGTLNHEHRQDAEMLKPLLIETVRPGDVIVVKSSKGIGFSKLVDALLKTFPAAAAGSGQRAAQG
jgi:UDP-N-acetylmuramoyl-tripeptide--D-alanyl-D-alanine ligase